MITQEHIDEWTRHAPAAGPERDLIIAQRAAQFAQTQAGVHPDRCLRDQLTSLVIKDKWQTPNEIATAILNHTASWMARRGMDLSAGLLRTEADRK